MNCKCNVEQRRLTPGVFNLKQFLNGTETMIWEIPVDKCIINDGTCNLANHDPFLTLCVGGEIDEIMLAKRQVGDTLQLIWDVGTYATALTGYVKYQISFRSSAFFTLGVIADDTEVNGVYSLEDWNQTGTSRVFKQKGNGYSIRWNNTNGRWELYNGDLTTLVDYQKTPATEPHCGTWNTVAVGNNEAAAWISDEAIMYISESIAADQKVTGNFPTILRQFWAKVCTAGVMSVNGKLGAVQLYPEDIGAAPADHKHKIKEIQIDNGGWTFVDSADYIGMRSTNGNLDIHHGGRYQGTVVIAVKNGDKQGTLSLNHMGQFVWNDQNIVRSVNSEEADASGNVVISAEDIGAADRDHAHYLEKVLFRNGGWSFADNSAWVGFHGSTGRLSFHQAGANKGAFEVAVTDGDKTLSFYVHANGTMVLGDKNIVRSVGGVTADAAGDVVIKVDNVHGLTKELQKYLPAMGGTMWGTIALGNEGKIERFAGTETGVRLLGANSSTGFYIYNTSASNTGKFCIVTSKDNEGGGLIMQQLVGDPGGGLCWNRVTRTYNADGTSKDTYVGHDITLGYPNYDAAVDLGTISSYTAQKDGWMNISIYGIDHYHYAVYVNDVRIGMEGGEEYQTGLALFPVKKGDIVKTTVSENDNTARTAFYKFFPNR